LYSWRLSSEARNLLGIISTSSPEEKGGNLMNPLVESLGPVFIVSFALQQLTELLDPILDKVIKPHKEWILSAVALVVGLLLTLGLGLRILRPFGVTSMPWLDVLLTALFVTGGTKWLNDLLKIIAYKKQEVQARAMMATQQVAKD